MFYTSGFHDLSVICLQSTSSLAMYPQELTVMDETFAYLSRAVVSAHSPNVLTATHVDAIIQILDRWPSSQRFPGF